MNLPTVIGIGAHCGISIFDSLKIFLLGQEAMHTFMLFTKITCYETLQSQDFGYWT